MALLLYDILSHLLLAVCTAIALCISFVVVYLNYLHSQWTHMPGPQRDSFFTGNILTLRRWRKERNYFFSQVLQEWSRLHGPTFVIFALHKPLVFSMTPEAVKEVLITGNHNKPEDWKFLGTLFGQRFIGKGLVTEPDWDRWSKRRAILNPAFHRKFLRSIMSEFNAVADKLVAKLKPLADGENVVDLEKELHHATLDVIGKVAFDKDLDSLHDSTSPFPQAIYKSLSGFSYKVKDPFCKFKFWKDREYKGEVRDACMTLREAGKQWLQERREAMERGEEVPDDTLTLIIKAQEQHPDVMDPDTVIDDIVTFFAAGQETTANSLSFSLLEIARNKDIKQKLLEEISSTLGSRTSVEFDDLNKFEYAGYIMKESLRLYPPATLLFREVVTDIKIDTFKVKKGTRVVVSPFVSGRCAEFHPDPLEFRPERFHPACEYRPSMYTYLPFSLGVRNCIGQNFAQIEGKVFLVKLMQHFDLKLLPDYDLGLKEVLTLRPENGVKCTLTLKD